jgi:hypothetical protein
MLLHSRKVHPGVEVHKFSPGPKAKNDDVVATDSSTRSLEWYQAHKQQVLTGRKQSRLARTSETYRNFSQSQLRDKLSSVLNKIACTLSGDGVPEGWHSEFVSMLLSEVDENLSVEHFPVFALLPAKKLTKTTKNSKKFDTTFTGFKSAHPKFVFELRAIQSALSSEDMTLDEALQEEVDEMSV